MPLKYRTIIQVLTSHGFVLIRQKGSHRQFEGFIAGKRHVVTIACHSENEDVLPNTLQSIIRQSGLPKRLFR
jgi:predicted RNA binding protein YcfA (HicA-like mRNA interferase family)